MRGRRPAPSESPESEADTSAASSGGRRVTAYLALTKPRITLMVTLSALTGYGVGSTSPVNWGEVLQFAAGVALLSSGIGALNQFWERDLDRLMHRTKGRPLPQGRMAPLHALVFGVTLALVAELYLAWMINPLTAGWGLVALTSYLFLYTPLKTRTPWCTFLGAIPGALPPLLGWTAARNAMGPEALVLFAILFLWQFPHFHAIATMYREDYARAGIRMLPVVEPNGRSTARQIVFYAALLLPVSLLPTYYRLSGLLYLGGAALLGLLYLWVSIQTAQTMTREQARRLLKVSVLYLPLLLALMVLNS
jgi:protoheme IX farnesyltransferase